VQSTSPTTQPGTRPFIPPLNLKPIEAKRGTNAIDPYALYKFFKRSGKLGSGMWFSFFFASYSSHSFPSNSIHFHFPHFPSFEKK
jgi:hypothetical protein